MSVPLAIRPYRPDIDGLRGIAVLAVVFHHFEIPGFSGGFSGVDIFFVISGYLITSLVLDELAAGRFTLSHFFARRVRRLAPALILLIIAALGAGVALQPPRAFEALGESVIASLALITNVYFWAQTTDYFGASADTKPFLHLWSLAVEEQFYLAFPIAVMLAGRLGRGTLWAGMLVAATASLVLAIWAAANAPTMGFYLLPTRAWELLLGAFLAHRRVGQFPLARRTATVAGISGLALLIAGITGATAGAGRLVPAALAPCLGTLLILWSGAGSGSVVTRRLLNWRPLVFVGLISYSLYLWHWPIRTFVRHTLVLEPLDVVTTVAAITASFAIAALSWRYVERPWRQSARVAPRPSLRPLFAASTMVLAASLAIVGSGGWPGRFPHFRTAEAESTVRRVPLCSIFTMSTARQCLSRAAPAAQPRLLLWGDSFAAHFAPAISAMRDELPFAIAQHSRASCPPILAYDPAGRPGCRRFNREALANLDRAQIDIVILSARWEAYRGRLPDDALGATIRTLRARKVAVIVVGQSPIFHFDDAVEFDLLRHRGRPIPADGRAASAVRPALNTELRSVSTKAGASFFDPTDGLCRTGRCLYRENGVYLVRNASHFTEAGARKVISPMLGSLAVGCRPQSKGTYQ